MTHKQVVIITPEPTSLTDGYAFITVLHLRQYIDDFHTPFLKFAPRSRAAKDIMNVAEKQMRIRSDLMEHITAAPPLRMGEPVT